MSDKLGLEITTIGGAESEKTINSIATAAENLSRVFKDAKGSTSALKELRQLLVGIKGKNSGLDELTASIKSLNSTAESMRTSFSSSFRTLGNTIQIEFAQVRNLMLEGGRASGKAMGDGVKQGVEQSAGAAANAIKAAAERNLALNVKFATDTNTALQQVQAKGTSTMLAGLQKRAESIRRMLESEGGGGEALAIKKYGSDFVGVIKSQLQGQRDELTKHLPLVKALNESVAESYNFKKLNTNYDAGLKEIKAKDAAWAKADSDRVKKQEDKLKQEAAMWAKHEAEKKAIIKTTSQGIVKDESFKARTSAALKDIEAGKEAKLKALVSEIQQARALVAQGGAYELEAIRKFGTAKVAAVKASADAAYQVQLDAFHKQQALYTATKALIGKISLQHTGPYSDLKTRKVFDPNAKAVSEVSQGIVKDESFKARTSAALKDIEAGKEAKLKALTSEIKQARALVERGGAYELEAIKKFGAAKVAAVKAGEDAVYAARLKAFQDQKALNAASASAVPRAALTGAPKTSEINNLNSSLKALTVTGNDVHSMARGLASGFGALWLTWGNLLPLFAGAAISNGFMKTVKEGLNVANTLETIAVLGENTSKEMTVLTGHLVDLGNHGVHGPLAVAEAMKTLSLAGLKVNDILSVTQTVMDFSMAGTTSIQSAADVLVSVTTAFGTGAAGFSRSADIIMRAAADSKASVESFGEAMKTASVVGQQYGATQEDVALQIQLLANLGITGSSAGTAVRNMFADITGRSGQVVKVLKSLGLEFKNVDGSVLSTMERNKQLSKVLSQYDAKSRGAIIQAIFGERGAKAAIAELAAYNTFVKDEYGNTVRKLELDLEKLKNSYGDSAIAAAKMGQTSSNAFKAAGATLETTLLRAFQAIEPQLYLTAQAIKSAFGSQEVVSTLTTLVSAVANLSKYVAENIGVITQLVLAYAGFRAMLALAGTALVGYEVLMKLVTASKLKQGLAAEALAATEAATTAAYAAGLKVRSSALTSHAAVAAAASGTVSSAATAAATTAAATTAATVTRIGSVLKVLPIIGNVISLLGLAWMGYDMWARKATNATDEYVNTKADNIVDALNKESEKLETINALRAEGYTLIQAETEAKFRAARAEVGIASASGLAEGEAQLNKLNKEIAAKKQQLDAPGGVPNLQRMGQAGTIAAEIRKLEKQKRVISNEMSNLFSAQARRESDLEAAIARTRRSSQEAAKRNAEQTAADLAEAQRQQELAFGTGGGKSWSLLDFQTGGKGGKGGKDSERQQFLMLQFSNELKQIEARMKSEIKLKETAYEADKKTLETRYAANLLSAVEYQSELTRLTQTSEKDRIGTYRAATQEYNQIMAEQLSGMENAYLRQIKGADVQNPSFKALKEGITGVQEVLKSTDQAYQDFATQLAQGNPSAEANLAETLLKNESALDKWVAQVKQQIDSLPEGPLKKLAAEMLNTAQVGITFNEATNNLSKGLSIKLLQDAEKAYADLAKQVGDATRAGQDFWRKSVETKEAAAALRQVEEHYSGVTDASTVALQAEKVGALARVQSLQASSEAMLQQRVAADAVAASLKNLYAEQAKALENGPTDVSGLSNLIKDTEALAASLQEHLAKGAANSGDAAGEAFALAYKGSVEQIFTTLSAMDFAKGFHDTSDALAGMLQGLDKAILAQEAYNLVKASTNDPQKLAKLEAQNSKNQIRSYGDMASAAKGFFREGSKGYKSLDTVSKAFRAAELAGAVFNTGKKLVLLATEVAAAGVAEANKTAISNTGEAARMPAKIAGIFASFMSMMGPWGVPAAIAAIAAVGLSAYGKSNSNTLAPTNEGKGTVFGDKEAKSESIGKTIDLLEGISKFAGIENSYAAKMLTSLRSIENSMGGVTNLVLRSNGAENAAAKVQQGYSDNGLTKAVSGAGTVMTVAKLVMGALNPLGFIADMLLGKLLAPIITKLFGTKTKVTGQGLYAADTTLDQVRAGGLEAGYYADINKKKKFFGVTYSDKNSTDFTRDDETSRQFSLILNGFVDSVKLAAPVLGFSLDQIDTNLKDFVVKIGRVDLKDLSGAEIQEKLAAVFGAAGDDIAKAAIPGLEKFQKVGEGYFETLARVASNLSSVNQMFDTLGVELLDSSIAGAEVSQAFSDLFGGLEDMASMVGGYYENFYTEAERELVLRRQLTDALAKQNLQMPVTRDGYRALVEAQDLTTEAGRKNFAMLMQNEAAFAKLTPAADSAATSIDNLVSKLESAFPAATASIKSLITEINRLSKLRNTVGNLLDKLADKLGGDSDFAKKREAELWAALAATTDLEKQIELAEALSDIVIARHQKEVDVAKTLLTFSQSLKTYVDGLKIGNISPLTTAEKLAEAGKQYNETLIKAKGGDVTAQGELQKAADAYLNLARTYYASSSAYTAIFNSVTGALSGLGANVKSQAEQQLEVGTNSLDELKKLYGTTETISFAIESQYNSAIEQLKVERDALASQLRTEDEFKAFNELFRGLPVELSGLFKDMLSGILKYSDERVAQAIREVKVSDPKSTIAGITDSAYKNFGISSAQIASVTPTLYSDKEVLSALQALRATDPAATLGAIRSTAYNNYGITPEQFNRVVKMDGSHYDGLDYVPFDGYIAELHKGERVITASENTAYSKNDNSELIEEISALRREVALLRESNREEANRQVEVTIKAAEVTGDIISSATNKAVHSKALKEKATVR